MNERIKPVAISTGIIFYKSFKNMFNILQMLKKRATSFPYPIL